MQRWAPGPANTIWLRRSTSPGRVRPTMPSSGDGRRRRATAQGRDAPEQPPDYLQLGAVCPPSSCRGRDAADIRYQAEQIATQKLHNGGHNCVSCQTLIMPEGWDQAQDLLDGFRSVVASAGERGVYYPGAKDRLRAFADRAASGSGVERLRRGASQELLLTTFDSDADGQHEVFAPAMNIKWLGGSDPAAFLKLDRLRQRQTRGHARRISSSIRQPGAPSAEPGSKNWSASLPTARYHQHVDGGQLSRGCPALGQFSRHHAQGCRLRHRSTQHLYARRVERSVLEAPWRPFPRGC